MDYNGLTFAHYHDKLTHSFFSDSGDINQVVWYTYHIMAFKKAMQERLRGWQPIGFFDVGGFVFSWW